MDYALAGFIISILALIVASIQPIIRIFELRRDRHRIEVSYTQTEYPDQWYVIVLKNPYSRPVMVDWWRLIWITPRLFWKSKIENADQFADEDLHCNLSPGQEKEFELSEQYAFNWNPKSKPNASLYIELSISGMKKPIQKLVYKRPVKALKLSRKVQKDIDYLLK